MSSLTSGRRNTLLLAVLLFAQLLLMSASVRRADGATVLESALLAVTRPLVGVTQWIGGGLRGAIGGIGQWRRSQRELVEIRSQLQQARQDLNLALETRLENDRLRQLLGMKEYLAPQSVAAAVITAHRSTEQQVIVIDRGTADGVFPDQAVLTWGGVVGRVIFADARTAKVRLLSDPWSSAAGMAQRSRENGMVKGQGGRLLEMAYVPSHADVERGDRIVSSGIDGVFPKGFGIGRVVDVSASSGIAKTILVEPAVDFSKLEEVLVVVGREPGPAAASGSRGEP